MRATRQPARAMLEHLPQLAARRVVLASASPRRAELLAQLGLRTFEIVVSAFDEDLDKAAFPGGAAYAAETARRKAADVAARLAPPAAALVIGADTVVEAADGRVLEKPADAADARRMLASLSGARHAVHTGVALVLAGGRELVFSETTFVEFGDLSAAAIAAYVASGEAEGKAGAYGIQGRAAAFVRRIEGDYFNVVGLPLHALCGALDGLIASGELEL